jgi:mono/diheme cytochrome c family protein
MKRFTRILTLTAGVTLLIAVFGPVYAQDGPGEGGEAEDEFAPIRGAAVYAEFCQACHGPQGEAIGTGAAFGAITGSVEAARDVIDKGRASDAANGAVMPPYGEILKVNQIDDLLAYLETWESGSVPPLPEPNIHGVPDQVPDYFGDPHAGAVVYAKFCDGCHGPEGEGRKKPDFPPFKFTGQTAAFVRDEHRPAFGESAGGPLSDTQITDLETYMASWKTGAALDEQKSEGVNVLIVVVGALAIVAIGGAYLSRIVATERA